MINIYYYVNTDENSSYSTIILILKNYQIIAIHYDKINKKKWGIKIKIILEHIGKVKN